MIIKCNNYVTRFWTVLNVEKNNLLHKKLIGTTSTSTGIERGKSCSTFSEKRHKKVIILVTRLRKYFIKEVLR